MADQDDNNTLLVDKDLCAAIVSGYQLIMAVAGSPINPATVGKLDDRTNNRPILPLLTLWIRPK